MHDSATATTLCHTNTTAVMSGLKFDTQNVIFMLSLLGLLLGIEMGIRLNTLHELNFLLLTSHIKYLGYIRTG